MSVGNFQKNALKRPKTSKNTPVSTPISGFDRNPKSPEKTESNGFLGFLEIRKFRKIFTKTPKPKSRGGDWVDPKNPQKESIGRDTPYGASFLGPFFEARKKRKQEPRKKAPKTHPAARCGAPGSCGPTSVGRRPTPPEGRLLVQFCPFCASAQKPARRAVAAPIAGLRITQRVDPVHVANANENERLSGVWGRSPQVCTGRDPPANETAARDPERTKCAEEGPHNAAAAKAFAAADQRTRMAEGHAAHRRSRCCRSAASSRRRRFGPASEIFGHLGVQSARRGALHYDPAEGRPTKGKPSARALGTQMAKNERRRRARITAAGEPARSRHTTVAAVRPRRTRTAATVVTTPLRGQLFCRPKSCPRSLVAA